VEITSVKFMLMVQDMARAIRFYHDVIGLEVKFESPEWTELAYGAAIVALHGGGKGEFRTTGLGFQVKDIRAACREITAGGGKIASPPMERPGERIILAEIVDTEGNQFSLTEYLPTSPEA
jgi:predicted enzyme related to lactoylglutathione lyase